MKVEPHVLFIVMVLVVFACIGAAALGYKYGGEPASQTSVAVISRQYGTDIGYTDMRVHCAKRKDYALCDVVDLPTKRQLFLVCSAGACVQRNR